MATIDVSLIKSVKYQNTPVQGIPVNIKPDLYDVNNKPINLTQDINHLLQAQLVLLENQWIILTEVLPPFTQKVYDIQDSGWWPPSATPPPPPPPDPPNSIFFDPHSRDHLLPDTYYFPKGKYHFDGVQLQNGNKITGSKGKTIFTSHKWYDFLQDPNMNTYPSGILHAFVAENIEGIIIEDIVFEKATRMRFAKCRNVTIRGCEFYDIQPFVKSYFDLQGEGMGRFFGVSNLLIENNILDKKDGIVTVTVDTDTSPPTYYRNPLPDLSCLGMGVWVSTNDDDGATDITIRNNIIRHAGDNGIGCKSILMGNPAVSNMRTNIESNKVSHVGHAGIKFTMEGTKGFVPFGNHRCVIDSNHVDDWGNESFESAISCMNSSKGPGGKESYSTQIIISNNTIQGSGRGRTVENGKSVEELYGIRAQHNECLVIHNNIITGTPSYDSHGELVFSGGTTGPGIYLGDVRDFTISGNIVRNCYYLEALEEEDYNILKGAINLNNCGRGTVHGNEIHNCCPYLDPHASRHEYCGIYLIRTRFCAVSGNTITDRRRRVPPTPLGNPQPSTLNYGIFEDDFGDIDVRSAANKVNGNMILGFIANDVRISTLQPPGVDPDYDPPFNQLPATVVTP